MDKIEVGEWVRTTKGIIGILKKQFTFGNGVEYPEPQEWVLDVNGKEYIANEANYENIEKHSKNKIELLEDSDFVELEYKSPKYRKRITRMFEVSKVDEYIIFENYHCSFFYKQGNKKITDKTCKNIKIKSVLTHEQFENIKYNFEEEN